MTKEAWIHHVEREELKSCLMGWFFCLSHRKIKKVVDGCVGVGYKEDTTA